MLPDELREFREVTLLLQDLTTKFCFRHLAIKVSRDGAIKGASSQSKTAFNR